MKNKEHLTLDEIMLKQLTIPTIDTPLTDAQAQMLLDMPFDPAILSWKPQTVKNNRAYPVVYVDARDVMDRLNWVLGPGNWETKYVPDLSNKIVECHLTVTYPSGKKVTRIDVGDMSQQPDQGDKSKAAYSDSLKRAAVQFGVGAYFYGIKADWVEVEGFGLPKAAVDKLNANLPDFAKPLQYFKTRLACCKFLSEAGLLNLLGGYKLLLLEDAAYEEIAKQARALYNAKPTSPGSAVAGGKG